MSKFETFALPDVGEGLTEAEIVGWRVAPGDTVTINQILVEIETAKAAVELPSPFAGTVSALLVNDGDTVDVGSPIITIDTDPNGSPAAAGPAIVQPTAGVTEEDRGTKIGEMTADGRIATLVGYVSPHTASARRPRKPIGATPGSAEAAPVPVGVQAAATVAPPAPVVPPMSATAPDPEPGYSPGYDPALAIAPQVAGPATAVPLASPPVRKLAKDLGVDLAGVTPTGPDGVITRADVQQAGTAPTPTAPAPPPASTGSTGSTGSTTARNQPSTATRGDSFRERRVPIRGVRKATAAAMVTSAYTAPQVTVFLTVDVTEMMALRHRLRSRPEFSGVKITPLTFAARAVCKAIQRTPDINALWDEQAQEIVFKEYVNLGIAAATPRGLVVPNVKDADRLDLFGMAEALTNLTETARTGKTSLADMTGGTFTISNIGVLGVDTGTPLINPGESAIMALGSIKAAPWVVDGELAVRQVCQLSLTFDHRVVDGQQGSRFLADVGALMAEPGLALAW